MTSHDLEASPAANRRQGQPDTGGAATGSAGATTPSRRVLAHLLIPYLQALPMALVFVLFFIVPVAVVVVVSFFDYQTYDILIPDFTLRNYEIVFSSSVTYETYLATLRYCLISWAITLVLGFTIAHFLAFHLRTVQMQLVCFLICTIPFWTSNVIRMISWIPFLGRNGLINQTLMSLGIVDQPQEWLLYSEFSVILGYVHLYTLFMIVPIFNSMIRIDGSLIEAASDQGANGLQVLTNVVIPLAKPGIAIGSIFVLALVMGDFITVSVLGGGQMPSVGKSIQTELSYLQFPPAAANAVVLLGITGLMIVALLRIVDIRKEL
jgi:putative spermidine/putrescine transport system permease protein